MHLMSVIALDENIRYYTTIAKRERGQYSTTSECQLSVNFSQKRIMCCATPRHTSRVPNPAATLPAALQANIAAPLLQQAIVSNCSCRDTNTVVKDVAQDPLRATHRQQQRQSKTTTVSKNNTNDKRTSNNGNNKRMACNEEMVCIISQFLPTHPTGLARCTPLQGGRTVSMQANHRC